ncbi:MAG: hypothetical protein LBS06_02665 [Treponema sp.]|nr:hypothetical protein [Treponema sp.]
MLIVILPMLFLTFHLETVIRVAGSWLFGEGPWKSELLFYLAVALILLLSGFLMCLAVMFVSRIEDRRYRKEQTEASRRRTGDRPQIMESVDSINASVAMLGELSARMKEQTRRLSSLNREMLSQEPERNRETPSAITRADTFSITLNDSGVSGLRVIYPAGFTEEDPGDPSSPQGPFPPPGSRQRIWYFPNI